MFAAALSLNSDGIATYTAAQGTFLAAYGSPQKPLTGSLPVSFRNSPGKPVKAGEKRRTFTDDEGVFWDVREVKNSDYDRRGGSSLLFESINAIRRVRNFPGDWHDWDPADLAVLSKRT